jgi:hypothetical protein
MKRLAFLAAVACLCGGVLPGTGRAGFIITISQVGPDVVVSGSGSVNTTGLMFAHEARLEIFFRVMAW